jgi:predicted RNA-binding Zn-ribbon protein involved in translation (DUF1610 family)
MPRYASTDPTEPWSDPDGPDDAWSDEPEAGTEGDLDADRDLTDDEEHASDTMVCPSCRSNVHEQTEKCPHCGEWITPRYPARRVRGTVFVIVAVALVVLVLRWALR